MRKPDGAAPPSDSVPRWQSERGPHPPGHVTRHALGSPAVVAVRSAALGMLGVGLSAAATGDPAGDFVPALVLGLLFLAFTIVAFRHRIG